jgi:DNA-binding MarR family transcriptional regulator
VDYTELAKELLEKMHTLSKLRFPPKTINELIHGEIFVLKYIAYQTNGVIPSEISHEMNVTSARIATALNSLENKGLIIREIDKKDRRKIIVKITQKGEELTEKHWQSAVEEVAKMLNLLGEHDTREFIRILGRFAELTNQPESEQL